MSKYIDGYDLNYREQLADVDRASIREFLEENSRFIKGETLDYGCGRQPYKELIETQGATYTGYDHPNFPGSVVSEAFGQPYDIYYKSWDTILCTQMLQYVYNPKGLLDTFRTILKKDGHLILTYATNWPEVESEDLNRFTTYGIRRLLEEADFNIIEQRVRATIVYEDFEIPFGGGVVAI